MPIGCSRPLIRPWAAGLPSTPIGTSSQTRSREFAVIRAAQRLLFPAARSCMCRRIVAQAKLVSRPDVDAELGEVLSGRDAEQTCSDEITIFLGVGLPLRMSLPPGRCTSGLSNVIRALDCNRRGDRRPSHLRSVCVRVYSAWVTEQAGFPKPAILACRSRTWPMQRIEEFTHDSQAEGEIDTGTRRWSTGPDSCSWWNAQFLPVPGSILASICRSRD